MRIISESDYDFLRGFVISDPGREARIRANVGVLYEKGILQFQIQSILGESEETIYILLKYLEFFGIKGYLELPFEEIKARVNEEEFRREKEKLKNRRKGLFFYLSAFFYSLFNILNILSAFLIQIFVFPFRAFSANKASTQENKNIAKFERGAENNYLIQINQLVVNEGGKSEEVKEKYIAKSKSQLQRKIEELIEAEDPVVFSNPTVDYLMEQAKQVKNNQNLSPDIKKAKITFYVSLIIIYLVYSSSFKGGIWIASGVIAITFSINLRACFPDTGFNPASTFVSEPSSSNVMAQHDSVTAKTDSILKRIEEDQEVTVDDYGTYSGLVKNFHEPDNTCLALSAMGQKQRQFIYEFDHVDHQAMDYFIGEPDQMYYVHVVSYSDIREAVFQMHSINASKRFAAKVLEVSKGGNVLYAVVIGSFKGNQAQGICRLADAWALVCVSRDFEIGVYFNG
jgi:hypothetical protein